MSVMDSLVRAEHTKTADMLSREVNKVVKTYADHGVADVVPGVMDKVRF
jgi:DNA helicase TIP49 (TBP-interacting protein)